MEIYILKVYLASFSLAYHASRYLGIHLVKQIDNPFPPPATVADTKKGEHTAGSAQELRFPKRNKISNFLKILLTIVQYFSYLYSTIVGGLLAFFPKLKNLAREDLSISQTNFLRGIQPRT